MIAKSIAVLSTLAISGAAIAGPVVINFDELSNVNQSISGDTYLGQGVSMRQVTSTPDATFGAFLSISQVSANIAIWSGTGAVSPNNYAYAEGTNDMFFSFTSPINSLSVDIDIFPEGPDIVRLAALVYDSNTNTYEVIAASNDTNDDPSTTVTLTVAPGQSFVHALFQSTTEQEGFDNLTFNVIPLPSGAALAGVGLLVLAGRRRTA